MQLLTAIHFILTTITDVHNYLTVQLIHLLCHHSITIGNKMILTSPRPSHFIFSTFKKNYEQKTVNDKTRLLAQSERTVFYVLTYTDRRKLLTVLSQTNPGTQYTVQKKK